MANGFKDFTKGFISTAAPDSLTDLKSDADSIRDAIMGGARTAQDKYREMRNSGGIKKVTDWFFRRGTEVGEGSSFENDDDDFDAGFKFGGDDDGEPASRVLDYDSMKDITKGHVSSLYNIAGKQTEASAMTASEIITTMNTRTSEILSSLGNINSSLQLISSKLDKIIELGSVKETKRARQRSLFDYSGNLTLGNTFDYLVENNPYASLVDSAKMVAGFVPTMFQTAGSSAEAFGSLLGMSMGLLSDKNFKILDNQSINEIKDSIDERVNNAQNTLLSKLLNWDKFKNLFGDLTAREKNKDYSSYIDNQYNRDKAVFDNMTRKTIIDVIPGYLRRITAALTGENLFVSAEGSLTTEHPQEFQGTFRSTIQSGFSHKRFKQMMESADSDINRNDVFMAQRVLVSMYVFNEMRVTGHATQGSEFENGGDPEVNERAIDMLTMNDSQKKSRSYWTRVIQLITSRLIADKPSRDAFARVVRQSALSTHNRAKRYAEQATITYDIGEVSDEMVENVVSGYIKSSSGKDDRTWQERINDGDIKKKDVPNYITDLNTRPSEEALKQARRERIKQSELIGNIGTTFRDVTASSIDYLASIFAILNRGINVWSNPRKTRYPKMKLIHAKQTQTPLISDNGMLSLPGPKPADTSEQEDPDDQQPTPTQQPSGGQPGQPGQPEQQPQISPLHNTMESIRDIVLEPIRQMKENISTDMASLKASTVDTALIEYNKTLAGRELADLGESEDDKNDKAISEAVLAAMNASVQDGDTKEDVGPLMEQISQIKNPKLKSRLAKVVEGTLQRAETKKPAQSSLGKILTWALGLAKTFILPKLQSAKTFLTTLGQKLFAPIIESFKQSGQRITGGARAIKEGIFGSEESLGLVGRWKEARNLKQLTSQLTEINEIPVATTKPLEVPKTDVSMASLVALDDNRNQSKVDMSVLSDIGDGKDFSRPSTADPELKAQLTKISEDVAEQKEETKKGNAITRAMDNFVERFKQTDFGKGFMSAFEKKKSNKEMKAETLSDQMTKSIADILKSKDGTGSVFGTIITKLTGIGDVVKEGINKLTGKSDTSGSSSTGGTTTNASGTTTTENGLEEINQNVGKQRQVDPSSMLSEINQQPTTQSTAKKGIGFDIGKILGGMTSILGGLLQAVLTVIMSMKAVKAIMNLGMKVLKTALQPLNKAFQSLYKAIKPVMKTIQNVLRQIVGYVVEIVESVIKFIQPLLEAIGPLLEQMLDILKPILDMLTDLINVLIVPLTAILQTVVVPILQGVGYSLQQITGLIQVGFGAILTVLGNTLVGIGAIAKLFGAPGLSSTGKKIAESGKELMTAGAGNVKAGLAGSLSLLKSTASNILGISDKEESAEEERTTSYREGVVETLNGSPMDGIIYGNGDVLSMYGGAGANQNRFGNYMNMGSRGCGPIALADAYARRSGNSINARGLTTAMASSGAYSPNLGTSVSGFMSTAGSMGMNLRAGGVTPASLKYASPHNPITIIGSGTDFTTRKGNNHFMNVIGSSGGTAFVSNPMNGRIERRSISSLAANSVAGLYGSGDVPAGGYNIYGSGDAGFQFSDEVQDKLSTLKDLVSGIIGMFTGDDSVEAKLKEEKDKLSYQKTMNDLGDMTEEERTSFIQKAFDLFKKENPRFEKETDAEYEKRFKEAKTYQRYLTQAGMQQLEEAAKKQAGTDEGTVRHYIETNLGTYNPETGKYENGMLDDLISSMETYDDAVQQGSFFSKLQDMVGDYWDSDEDAGFYSDNGARLYTDEYTPSVFDTSDAVHWKNSAGYWPNIPMLEWLKNTMPGMSGMSSAYQKYGTTGANEEVIGLDGSSHTGTDFHGPEGTPIRATTDGVVIYSGAYGSGGNAVRIQDVGGDIHSYFHMVEPSSLQVGDEVSGGDVIGHVGNTGNSTGPHLHYQIETSDGSMLYNPHTFFKWHEGRSGAPYGPIDFTGQLEDGNVWDMHKNKTGVSKFMQTAFSAGLTGPEVATITSTGIWEDAGEKLWGSKSLTNTTYDYNGQQAVGIMNWMDKNVDYGDTVEEQLQYIQRTYFDGDSKDFRAQVRHTDYDSADLEAYNAATGRSGWELTWGDLYGPYMNEQDLIEGSEHFFRGALVPACIHTIEGPRKYIGTAVGVYNWLLDEGYISDSGDASNISYNGGTSISPSSLTEQVGFSNTAAASSAQYNATVQEDKTDGVPAKYDQKSTGLTGTAWNAAGQKLFDYYVPVPNNAMANKNWIDKHTYTKHIANFRNGKFVEIYVDSKSYPATTAGKNAKALIEKYDNDDKVPAKQTVSQSTFTYMEGIPSGGISTDDLRKVWRSIFSSYSSSYANKMSRTDLINDFNGYGGYAATASHNTHRVIYDTTDGNLYYKNYKNAGKIYVKNGQIHWPDIAPAQVNDGTNVINTANNQGTTTTTTVSQVSKDRAQVEAAIAWAKEQAEKVNNDWVWSSPLLNGGGDTITTIPTGFNTTLNKLLDTGESSDQTAAPVVVNNYAVDTNTEDVINALMSNTYNIRSEEIESLLAGMLKLMNERKKRGQTATTKSRTSKQSRNDAAFPDQGIPRQIERLSVG